MALPEVLKELLENGVHFGHLSKHWNPKMKRFIFGKKKDVYIIDLEKTVVKLEEAKDFLKKTAEKGGKILFVGTKKQLRDLIKEQAVLCGMPFVAERWVGGFLTNFSTVKTRVKKYEDLLKRKAAGEFDKMPGKELVRLNRELERMEKNYCGVIGLDVLPTVVLVVDPKKEVACVREANRLSLPLVGIIDTDADPDVIDWPIPGNDDAIRSVKCIMNFLVSAIKEGIAASGGASADKDKKSEDISKSEQENKSEIS